MLYPNQPISQPECFAPNSTYAVEEEKSNVYFSIICKKNPCGRLHIWQNDFIMGKIVRVISDRKGNGTEDEICDTTGDECKSDD